MFVVRNETKQHIRTYKYAQNQVYKLMDLIDDELTERQRTAMLAMVQGNMPISEIAHKMETNPNALYKLLHDARKRLQEKLEEKAGLSAQEIMVLFQRDQ